MSRNVEGTLHLEGLIEGPLPESNGRERLKEWVRTARDVGLNFDLKIEGSEFSLLAPSDPLHLEEHTSASPVHYITELLQQLIDTLPESERHEVFSTLRAVEYKSGLADQTVFAVRPDGSIDTVERTVEADTVAPPSTADPGTLLKGGAVVLFTILFLLFIGSYFVDYRKMVSEGLQNVWSPQAADIQVENEIYQPYYTVEKVEVTGRRNPVLTLKFTRKADYPVTKNQLNELLSKTGEDPRRRLKLERLAEGYVRGEFFDEDDQFLGSTELRIKPLRNNKSTTVKIPLPPNRHPARLVLTY